MPSHITASPSPSAGPGGSQPRPRARGLTLGAAALAAVVGLVTAVFALQPAAADENPYQRGPDPTVESVRAEGGTFETEEVTVEPGHGFNGGKIYYPTDTSQGTWGAVAVVPGYTASWENEGAWMGHWIASFGFVVIGIDTNTPNDWDDARGAQLLSALDYLTTESEVADRVDPDRLAVMGHSMGGGGAVNAATQRPDLQAAIPFAPASFSQDMSGVQVPTMIMGAMNDEVVTPGSLDQLWSTKPAGTPGAYVQLSDGGHGFPVWGNAHVTRLVVPWLKTWVDNDTRYTQFLCDDLADKENVASYQSTCPFEPGGTEPAPEPTASPTVSPSDPGPTSPGPGPSEPVADGPPAVDNDFAVTREAAFGDNRYTVFRPSDPAEAGGSLPVVAFGNGACAHTDNSEVTNALTYLASKGFVVVDTGSADGSDNGVPSGEAIPSLLTDAITWAEGENERAGSPLAGQLDLSKVATAGHSCGGIEALVAGQDERISAVVALNSGLFEDGSLGFSRDELGKLHTPVMFLEGGPSDIAYENSRANYDLVGVPAVLASNPDAGHSGFISGAQMEDGMHTTVSFLDMILNSNETARAHVLDPSGLGSLPPWEVAAKNF